MEIKPISKKTKLAVLASAIVTGVLFCCLGISLFQVLFTIIGAFIIFGGVLSCFSKNIIAGLILAALGIFIVIAAWVWPNVPFIIFGVMMLLSGILGFISAVQNEDARSVVSSVLSAVLGGFLIGYHEGADWIIFVIGALFIVTGIIGIILVCIPSKKDVKTVDVKPIEKEDK